MFQLGPYVFKPADSTDEFDQIHALNHSTFVREIPQHHDPGGARLVDKFHSKSVYFIAKRDTHVVGMLSVHDQPPFSVADRLPDPGIIHRAGVRPLEVRLLAVEPTERATAVFGGLAWSVLQYVRETKHTHLFISGFEGQRPLYDGLGFEPLGPAVGPEGSRFVPMCVTVSRLEERHARTVELWQRRIDRVHRTGRKPSTSSRECSERADARCAISGCDVSEASTTTREVCLLPGPVSLSTEVQAALQRPLLYHRSDEFVQLFERIRRQLSQLVRAREVAMFVGSGTLANDVVAATLAAGNSSASGLILENGEFGQRLVQHAARAGLRSRVLSWPWGTPWDLNLISAALDSLKPRDWIWCVHQETSTGVLNDFANLVQLARSHGVRVCVDAVSSLGAVPLDLRDVFLASGTSGKALGGISGIALVFANREEMDSFDVSRLSASLDLVTTLTHHGPRFTFPSPQVQALDAAVSRYANSEQAAARFEAQRLLGQFVRDHLRSCGLTPLADDSCASPVVTTFAPPGGLSSRAFVKLCREWGYLIGGESTYLAERRLVQIATMGAISPDDILPLFRRLHSQGLCHQSEQ